MKTEGNPLRPANDNRIAEKERLTVVYWITIDDAGNETGSYAITLRPDGQADLSQLPADIKDTLETFGSYDKLSNRLLFPKDGEFFLKTLLANSNAYQRVRHQP